MRQRTETLQSFVEYGVQYCQEKLLLHLQRNANIVKRRDCFERRVLRCYLLRALPGGGGRRGTGPPAVAAGRGLDVPPDLLPMLIVIV